MYQTLNTFAHYSKIIILNPKPFITSFINLFKVKTIKKKMRFLFVYIAFIGLIISIPTLYANSNPNTFDDSSFFTSPYYSIEPLDLNRDGWPDIIFVTGSRVVIFWGSALGFSDDSKTELEASSGANICVADLNRNGYPDIIVSQFSSTSYIYWGGPNGFSNSNRTELETDLAWGVSVSDLNGNGWLDIVFANYGPAHGNADSYIYWGGSNGDRKSVV